MADLISPRPRVLHLFSDWKWTGPAESIVNLCRGLRRRGHAVDMACTRAPSPEYRASIEHRARERRVEPITEFRLRKNSYNPMNNIADVRAVAEYIDREEVQIVHVHTGHDHYIGSRAARRANAQPFVVRTNHTGQPLPLTLLNRWLIKGKTHGWVAFTESCRDADARAFGISPGHAVAVEGSVDLTRFHPGIRGDRVRAERRLGPENVVVGIVARVQSHRRFDILLPALALAMKQMPTLRAMVIGRGTNIESLAHRPAQDLGIMDKVIFTGYRGEDFTEHVAAIDMLLFLVPGSDGACRAVREAMAIGKPILASRRGLLPELVEDGRCGLVVDDTVETLSQGILRLAGDAALRQKLGHAAAEKARTKFDIDRQIEPISELYTKLAESL